MKTAKKIWIGILAILIFLITAGVFFKLFRSDLVDFLSMNKPLEAEKLVIEGWISDRSLDAGIEEFYRNDYDGIIVTGTGLDPWVLMPTEDYLEFSFPEKKVLLDPGDEIGISLKSTDLDGVYAEYSLFLNDSIVNTGTTGGDWKEYIYRIDDSTALRSVSISFNNDSFRGEEDINLYIGDLRIGDSIINPRSENSYYYHRKDKADIRSLNIQSVADLAAISLEEKGISRNKIVSLPSPHTKKNRTYSSALSLRDWVDSTEYSGNVNILSENIHARRTHLLYSYALEGSGVHAGAISIGGTNDDAEQNIKITEKSIVRELLGYLYYRYFFYRSGH
jgi:hypothetical protein